MKYQIVIYKITDSEKDDFRDQHFGLMRNSLREESLFRSEMDSDSCIEILQHLHDLKDRKTAN